MDFDVQMQNNYTWVVVDRLTKSPHFINFKTTYSVEDYARIFIDEILFGIVFLYPSYRIGVNNSHLGFGGHSKNDWVQR